MSTKAELFAIECGINYATQLYDVKHIIVIINTILAAKLIFDTSIYQYQLHSIAISSDLKNSSARI